MTINICDAPAVDLLWSYTADRAIAYRFDNAVFDQEIGNIWVFAAATADIDDAYFRVEGTAIDGVIEEDEFVCPFDVQGSNVANNDPGPLDLSAMSSGTLQITMTVVRFGGSTQDYVYTAFVGD